MVMDPSVFARRFPAQADQVAPARREVVAYAREHGAIDPDGIALAVSEAVTNAVVHAYIDAPEQGAVEVFAKRRPDDGIEIHVYDEGRGMMPRRDSRSRRSSRRASESRRAPAAVRRSACSSPSMIRPDRGPCV